MAERSREAIDFIFKNRGRRRMNISTTLHGTNAGDVAELVEFCGRNWPGLKVFIQPAVVGRGWSIRAEGEKVDPKALFQISRLPNVANNDYFNRVCADYYSNPDFEFKCRAGRLFFGVRPDGAFWACHDVPTPLNILDEDFFAKWSAIDMASIADPKKCGSCIYSCYINLQKGIEDVSVRKLFRHLADFRGSFKRC